MNYYIYTDKDSQPGCNMILVRSVIKSCWTNTGTEKEYVCDDLHDQGEDQGTDENDHGPIKEKPPDKSIPIQTPIENPTEIPTEIPTEQRCEMILKW